MLHMSIKYIIKIYNFFFRKLFLVCMFIYDTFNDVKMSEYSCINIMKCFFNFVQIITYRQSCFSFGTATFYVNNENSLYFSLKKFDHCLLLELHNMIVFSNIYACWMEHLNFQLKILDPKWLEKLALLQRKYILFLISIFMNEFSTH